MVVDPMTRRAAAQGGLWGRQEMLPGGRAYHECNDIDLFVAVARTAMDPGYVVVGPAYRVFRRDPSHPGHVEPVASYEAAMVAQMLDSGNLKIGGTHHVTYGRREGPARSVLVSQHTRTQLTRWANLRRASGAAS
jgi:hypothetical protein